MKSSDWMFKAVKFLNSSPPVVLAEMSHPTLDRDTSAVALHNGQIFWMHKQFAPADQYMLITGVELTSIGDDYHPRVVLLVSDMPRTRHDARREVGMHVVAPGSSFGAMIEFSETKSYHSGLILFHGWRMDEETYSKAFA